MRTELIETVDGPPVEVLVPETPEDVEELQRRDDVDDAFSFADRDE